MRRQWIVRRTMQQDPDGQRRWDRAYQELLAWTSVGPADEVPGVAVLEPPSPEVDDESCGICPRLDAASGASTDSRAAVGSAEAARRGTKLARTRRLYLS